MLASGIRERDIDNTLGLQEPGRHPHGSNGTNERNTGSLQTTRPAPAHCRLNPVSINRDRRYALLHFTSGCYQNPPPSASAARPEGTPSHHPALFFQQGIEQGDKIILESLYFARTGLLIIAPDHDIKLDFRLGT